MEEPIFIDSNPDIIVADFKANYESLTGMQLAPGQAEMLLIQAISYRIHLNKIEANEAAKQNLLAYARYPMIDYLGELVGVTRLPAAKAICTIQFTLVGGHPTIDIPAGIRVQSPDGKAVFITLVGATVPAGTDTVNVAAECTVAGDIGNNYPIGAISIILDPQAFVAIAGNIEITDGGADTETDDGIRERIKLAPSAFSSAGPDDAYIYFAKSANQSIIDVGIKSPIPGHVNIYPLLENAATPSADLIAAIEAKVTPKKVRPLNDIVNVVAPTKKNYAIEVNVILLTGSVPAPELAAITASLTAYADQRKRKLGRNAVRSQINAASKTDAVYSIEVIQPAADVTADFSEVAFCTGITVNLTGYSDE
ncbi:MAG: baseplate J/gp47 family protein [Sphingobacteriaceae bacterium]|nr:baseplate J/gp47 family protein [Sphingobacteriaceae bacterium]